MIPEETRPPGLPLIALSAAALGLVFALTFSISLTQTENPSFSLGRGTGSVLMVVLVVFIISKVSPKLKTDRFRYIGILCGSGLLLVPLLVQTKHAIAASAYNESAIVFIELPTATWTHEELVPPDQRIARLQRISHIDGKRQIIMTTLPNPSGSNDLPAALRGFKGGMSNQGIRITSEETITLGQLPAAKMIGVAGNGEDQSEVLVIFTLGKRSAHSIVFTSQAGPIAKDPELTAFIKSINFTH